MFTSDWHQHSHHSIDCRETGRHLDCLQADMAALGVVHYGVTDHVHTPGSWDDLAASRADYLGSPRPAGFHFGVEVSVVSQWELDLIATGEIPPSPYGFRSGGPEGAAPAAALTADNLTALGIEYVVGGAHWPLYAPYEREAIIRDYHRQNLFLATHPLVTIIAHPWWWMGHWQEADGSYQTDPWLDDFGKVPAAMHDEFVAAVRQHGKVVEANMWACLCNASYPERFGRQYAETLADWQARGVTLSLASDDHATSGLDNRQRVQDEAVALLQTAGVRLEELWVLGD